LICLLLAPHHSCMQLYITFILHCKEKRLLGRSRRQEAYNTRQEHALEMQRQAAGTCQEAGGKRQEAGG
jgi:hypothetical protein